MTPPAAPIPHDAASTAVYADYLEEYGDDADLLAYWRLLADVRRELGPHVRQMRQSTTGRHYEKVKIRSDVKITLRGSKKCIFLKLKVLSMEINFIWKRHPWYGFLEPVEEIDRYYREKEHFLARVIFEEIRGEDFRKISDPEG